MLASGPEQTRHEFYAAVRSLDFEDPTALLEFQFHLSDAILEAESATVESGGFNRHVFLLRRCQDALAFRLLVPHAIRQLLGTASPRAHCLSGQGEAFQATRQTAERYAADGHLVLIADLSHIVRLGDIIVCDNPCAPSIIEVKAGRLSPKHATQGRRGRQASRSLSTVEYLTNDHSQIFDQETPKLAVQSREATQFNWTVVNEVTNTALREGVAVSRVSDYDIFIAVRAVNGQPISGEPIVDDIKRMRSPYFASHAAALLNPELLTRPPLAWPIEDEPTFPLMEERLVVGHLIDLARFTDPIEEGFRILDVSHDRGFVTKRNDERASASARFIDEVMFGYATIESTVAALREMHDLTKSALENWAGELPKTSPTATAVETQGLNLSEQPAAILETKDARFRIKRANGFPGRR